MIKIPHTFWDDVEKDLKYVLYGDSVSENSYTYILIQNQYIRTTLLNIWNILIDKYDYKITQIDNHEYIFIDDYVEIITYSIELGCITYKTPNYIMRHKFKGELVRIYTDYVNYIDVTKNHSLIDVVNGKIQKSSPIDVDHVYVTDHNFLVTKKTIESKENIQYDGYVYDFELDTHNFIINDVLVHNTDSLYINIPQQFDNTEDSIKSTEETANKINDLIKVYYNGFLLPKTGVDSKYNETFFKTELTMDSIMFLETKKNYAYNITSKEGKIFNPVKTEYKGVPVVKSDTTPFTKDLLKTLIERIALNKEADSLNDIDIVAKEFYAKIDKCISDFDLEYISAPGKWSDANYLAEPISIIGMKLFNTISNKDIFRSGSFGIYFKIEFKNKSDFMKNIESIKHSSTNFLGHTPITKINYITLPYNYNKEEVSKLFDQWGLFINTQTMWEWEKLAGNAVVKRVISVIKNGC